MYIYIIVIHFNSVRIYKKSVIYFFYNLTEIVIPKRQNK